jgi:hypothetical protein
VAWHARPLFAWAIGIAWAVLFISLVVWRAGDVSGPIHLGGRTTDPNQVPPGLIVQQPDQSYDGQYFYRQAVSPLSNARWLNGVTFDAPGLRSARITYPALSWAVGAGRPAAMPLALLVVNALAAATVALAGVLLARSAELAPPGLLGETPAGDRTLPSASGGMAGLCFVLLPGVTYAMALDLADAVATAALVGALVALTRRRPLWVCVALAVALLSRESTVLLAGPIALVSAIDAMPNKGDWAGRAVRRFGARVTLMAAPFALAATWQLFVRSHWGEAGWTSSGDSNLRLPFSGLFEVRDLFWPDSGPNLLRLFVLVTVYAAAIVGAIAAVSLGLRNRWPVALAIATAVFAFVCLSPTIMSNHHNFGRSATELFVAVGWAAVSARGRLRAAALGVIAIPGAVLAVWEIVATTRVR